MRYWLYTKIIKYFLFWIFWKPMYLLLTVDFGMPCESLPKSFPLHAPCMSPHCRFLYLLFPRILHRLPDICEYLILHIVELMQVELHDVNYLKDHLFEPNSIISFIFIGIKNVIICHDLFIYLSMDIWTFCHYKQACYEHSCTYILVYLYSLSFRIHTREWNFWNI